MPPRVRFVGAIYLEMPMTARERPHYEAKIGAETVRHLDAPHVKVATVAESERGDSELRGSCDDAGFLSMPWRRKATDDFYSSHIYRVTHQVVTNLRTSR